MSTSPRELYPLRFAPRFRHYVWGGRRLATLLGKDFGPETTCAESWELCDRADEQTPVLAGAFAGTTLGQLTREHGSALLGRHAPQGQFPLLIKLLDAREKLSVQVHPDDARAARLNPPERGKTEAWVVLACEPGSMIYAGLQSGVGRRELEAALAEGTCEGLLHAFEPAVGDCLFLPAGAVHALGAGLLVAEVQQTSDTTYRLFDWNRQPPRPLHIAEGLEATNFELGPISPVTRDTALGPNRAEPLVACPWFRIERWRLTRRARWNLDREPLIIIVVSGTLAVSGDPVDAPLRAGQTMLLPASLEMLTLEPRGECELLAVRLGV